MRSLQQRISWRLLIPTALAVCVGSPTACAADNPNAKISSASFVDVVRDVRPKIVKIYGAGGPRGLEAYQSGMLISAQGDILTAWSYVLDSDDVTAVLDDGRRFSAKLSAADPLTEIAVLKIDAGAEPLPYFDLTQSPTAEVGTAVLAFSNLFGIAVGDEPVSVLHGYIATVAPLEARHGAFSSNFRGDVYIVDAATNNPGASGGALTDPQGRLVGMLGKELRSELTGTWLNYSLPVAAFRPTVEAILAGKFKPAEQSDTDRPEKPLSFAALGIVLMPDVVTRTPPYIDRVLPGSPAAKVGIRQDDLLVRLDSQVINSCRQATSLIERSEHNATVSIAVLRDDALLEFSLNAAATAPAATSETSENAPLD